MQDVHSAKVPYKRPHIGAFQIHAAVPALAAPLAITSVYSAAAFVASVEENRPYLAT